MWEWLSQVAHVPVEADPDLRTQAIWSSHAALAYAYKESFERLERLPLKLTQGDPATGAPYAYHRLSDTAFEVCATLALDPAEARKAAFDQDTIALRANDTLCFIGDRAGFVN